MFSSASVQDQQSVVGSMQATILPLTEPIQRIELQPCSRCCQAEANAAESITHLSSGSRMYESWQKAKHCISDLDHGNQRIATLEAQVAALSAQGPVQEAQPSASASTSLTQDKANPSMQPTVRQEVHIAHVGQEEAQNRQEIASSNETAAADPSLSSTDDTSAATSSQEAHSSPPASTGLTEDKASSAT
ncbi:TPA: hypothetical protein ACH3X1_010148 [Trebouxia sp. C0004]